MMKNIFKHNYYKAFAFIKKDFIEEASYKFAFLTGIFYTFLHLMTFFFLSKLFSNAVNPYLQQYGGDYFSFVLLGMAFMNYMSVSLLGFSSSIQRSQTTGTLEAILVTKTSLKAIIISSTLYNFIWTSINVMIYIIMGALLFNVKINTSSILPAFVVLILSIVGFSSVGILSASFLLIFKRGDPITGLFMRASFLFGGVYYPVTIFPVWLKKLSFFIPLTHSLEGMRMCLLKGSSFYDIRINILFLLVFSIIMLPLSVVVFKYAIKKAKIEGSLIKY